jgi:prevent-host-death family protein
MATTTALEFQRKFGEFQHRARQEPVEITRHGRREFVLMTAEHYDWLRAAAERSHRTETAPDFIIEAVERAAMDREQGDLDRLMD